MKRPRQDDKIGSKTAMWEDSVPGRDHFGALVGVLRQQHAALTWLAFKLSEAELLTGAHEARFLPMIVDEVDDIADEIGTIEVARAMIVSEVCDSLGTTDDDISLLELIAAAPPAVQTVLTDLRSELLELTADLATVSTRGSDTVRARLSTVKTALDNLEPAAPAETGYTQWGSMETHGAAATKVDTAL